MAILSNVDIEEEMRSGRIVIEPKPTSIGPISLDLRVDEISEMDMKHPKVIFKEMHIFECDSLEDFYDYGLNWKAKIPDILNDGYLLRKYHWYMVKHHEKVKSDSFKPKLVKRSSAARRGLYQLAGGVEDGVPTEVLVPFISNVVRKGESITQVVFSEPNTRRLTGKEFNRTNENDFGYFHGNQIERNIILATKLGFTSEEIKRITDDEEMRLGLTLDPVVKYFDDSEDENGTLYSKDKFVEIDLRDKSVPTFGGHTKVFTLAKSFDKIHIGNGYVGELLRAAASPAYLPINWGDAVAQILTGKYVHATITNCSAPYIQPGSDGHVVFEVPQGSGLQPYTHMSLMLLPVRTPGMSYNNRLNKTGEIIVP